MNNFRTSPNQKIITVEKEKCDKQHLYTTINLLALETAGAELKAGAFKLWVYIAKNQNNFTFGLSNKAVAECFGIKKDQYDNAVKELIEKGYLIEIKNNEYVFKELAEKTTIKCGKKPYKEVVKTNTEKELNPIRNNTNNTNDNTIQNEFIF